MENNGNYAVMHWEDSAHLLTSFYKREMQSVINEGNSSIYLALSLHWKKMLLNALVVLFSPSLCSSISGCPHGLQRSNTENAEAVCAPELIQHDG